MKKFLSLVLALVMTMSLVTLASAKDFTDDSSITYEEAVDVLSAIGVIDGYTDGSFKPETALNRGQAAKIICNLILGPTTASALSADAAPFKDVPADHVFAGYIAYCAQQGIINGYADGTFRPGTTLDGYSFLKMLLGALGYDGATEGYTGPNWSIQVAKRALSIGLDAGNDDFSGSKAVTREEACLYAFNTLKATMVEYENSSTITVGDIVISNNSKAEEVDAITGRNYNNAGSETLSAKTLQFCEKHFKNLKLNEASDVVDSFGRPAHTWTNGTGTNAKIGTYADSAVLTYTAAVKGTVLAGDIKDAGYTVSATAAVPCVRNGGTANNIAAADIATALASTSELGGRGVAIELYADSNDVINKIVVVATYLGKVTAITKDKTTTPSVDERALTIAVDGLINGQTKSITVRAEDELAGFDAIYEVAEANKTMVLVTPKGDNSASSEALTIAIPETAEGAVSYVSSSKVTIGGETYEIAKTNAATYSLTASDKSATVYLDQYGYAIGFDGPSTTGDNSIVLTDVYSTLEDGKITPYVKGITSNGEEVDWKYENSQPAIGQVFKYADADNDGKKELTPVSFTSGTVNSDNVSNDSVVYVGKAGLAASAKKIGVKVAGGTTTYGYFTSDVKFIFVDSDGKSTVAEGVQKVAANSEMIAVIKVNDNDSTIYVDAVYVLAAPSASSTTSDDIVFLAGTYTGTLKMVVDGKDKDFYEYKAYINGEKVDTFYAVESDGAAGFYTIDIQDASKAYVLSSNGYNSSNDSETLAVTGAITISQNNKVNGSNILSISTTDYDMSSAKVVDTTTNGNDLASVGDLNNAIAAGDVTVYMVLSEKTMTVDYVYVTAYTAF